MSWRAGSLPQMEGLQEALGEAPVQGCGTSTGHRLRVGLWPAGGGQAIKVGLSLLHPLWVCLVEPRGQPAFVGGKGRRGWNPG